MHHTQPLHLRLVPLCHQVTPCSPSPPRPGRDSRFPDIWNFCCATSYGSRWKLVHFPRMFWHWDVPAVQVSPCALFTFLIFKRRLATVPVGRARWEFSCDCKLCYIPCLSSLSSPGFPLLFQALCACAHGGQLGITQMASVATIFPNFPYVPSIKHGGSCLSPRALAEREGELPFLLVFIIPQAAKNPGTSSSSMNSCGHK